MSIQWQAPNDLGTYGVSFYNVSVYDLIPNNRMDMILVTEVSTEGNETHANITGLQPGMSFRIHIAGISVIDHNFNALGQSSASLLVNTSIVGT